MPMSVFCCSGSVQMADSSSSDSQNASAPSRPVQPALSFVCPFMQRPCTACCCQCKSMQVLHSHNSYHKCPTNNMHDLFNSGPGKIVRDVSETNDKPGSVT